MRSFPTRGLCLAVAALALVVGGCGGGEGDGAPEALSGDAAAAALADAARATNEVEDTVEGRLAGSLRGLPSGDQEFSLEALIDPPSSTGSFEVSSSAGSFELLLLEGAAYLASDEDAFLEALPEGAEWVELDAEDLQSLGLETSFFGEAGVSPQLYLVLGAEDIVAGEVEEVGGDPVRSYNFSIDKEAAVAEAPEASREDVDSAIRLEGDDPRIEGEASIDGAGRMRSFSALGTVGSPDSDLLESDQLEVRLELEYLDFGVEVPSEPPSDEVTAPLEEAPGAVEALSGIFGGDPG